MYTDLGVEHLTKTLITYIFFNTEKKQFWGKWPVYVTAGIHDANISDIGMDIYLYRKYP